MRKKILLTSLLLAAFGCFCQVEYPFNYIRNSNYFGAYTVLDSLQKQYVGSNFENEYWQAKGTLYSFLGKHDYSDYCYYYRDSLFNKLPIVQERLILSEIWPLTEMQSICNDYNVVMLNEAHNKSVHRAFLYNQLSLFHEMGFNYLALEALNNYQWLDSSLSKRGYPLYTQTGIYINDPIYGQVIRKAIELGFELIAYDHYGGDREKNQALNIYNQYDPEKGKLLIYAGYAHICEDSSRKLMGYYLKELLSDDVLTLSQVIPTRYSIEGICSQESQVGMSNNDCYDYYIIPAINSKSNNIFQWMSLLNYEYQPLEKYYQTKISPPYLIQLFYPGETNGIPVYQYLVDKHEDSISMAFPHKGDFSLVITNDVITDTIPIQNN